MRITETIVVYILFTLIFFSVVTIPVSSHEDSIPFWNRDWSFRQEIILPISTNNSYAKYQPIDIQINFDNPCWTKNENETSIRVCCWDGKKWHELESQIYDFETNSNYITECNLVFLVPEIANGKEKYYVYYDNNKKSSPKYKDHVSVEDLYYSCSLISDISTEAKYYNIKEDGYCVYGVGQEGKLLDRPFSQIVVKQKKGTENFDALNSDQIASFAFSYYYGNREKEESSSDQSFVHKKIFVDGNLMVEFGIISQSDKKDVRTTAIYKYYYSPLVDEKRICVRVKHELLEEAIVKGKENIDGRFGSLVSVKSMNSVMERMNFGEILPYLHFYGENNNIEEYQMNINPESKNREWIISFKDDADLGKEAWFAYGEGEEGKTNSIIFSSNKGIVKSGTDERDGIQLKVAEREYFDFLSTEVDYASINFGRNSYERGYSHDLEIPENLVVEFDAELFTSEDGGYAAVQKEAEIYQQLVKYRHLTEDPSFEKEQKKYDLEVITRFGGTRLSFPRLANRTDGRFPVMWIELYRDGQLISSGATNRSLIFRPFCLRSYKIFPEIAEGDYLIKVYWKLSNSTKFFNGVKAITLDKNKKVHVFCTFQRKITLTFQDQNGQAIEGINAFLLNKDSFVVSDDTTDSNGKMILKAPYSPRYPYTLKAFYRDFVIYDGIIKSTLRNIETNFDIELYDLTVEVKDEFDLPPYVEITPTLSGSEANGSIQIISEEIGPGRFFFENVPSGDYTLQITYANFVDEKYLNLPEDGDFVSIKFTAIFDITVDLFDSRGNLLNGEDVNFEIIRDGKQVYESDEKTFSLPPASYTIKAYNNGELVGTKELELTSGRNVQIVTTLTSILPTLIVALALIFIGVIIILTLIKRLSLRSLLKLLVIAFVVIALIQPWWGLSGSSSNPIAERDTKIFMNPEVMIESTSHDGKTTFDVAEMPEVFVDLLGKIVLVAYAVCIVLGLSFISNKLGKKQYSLLFSLLSIILLIAIISMFYVGTSKLCEASIGDVQGEGFLSVSLDHETVDMQSSWGFGSGFYLVIASVILIIISFFSELKKFFTKQNK